MLFSVLIIVLILILVGFIVNSIFFKNELTKITPYGKIVNVNEHKMHLYSMGNGDETIVILPGFGISLPSADFGPLMRKLSENYKVVTVEYFGTGFSDQVSSDRTNENYINEIRTMLNEAGFKPPYILMPHAAGGIYSEYYATKYPGEISSIIMLDTTSTASFGGTPPSKFVYNMAKFQQAIGLTRLLGKSSTGTRTTENGYTEKELLDYKRFNCHLVNNTIINQSNFLMKDLEEVNALDFPRSIPVLKILSTQTLTAMGKCSEEEGMVYHNLHLDKLGENASYKVIDSSHFMYHTNVDDISDFTNEFLNKSKILA